MSTHLLVSFVAPLPRLAFLPDTAKAIRDLRVVTRTTRRLAAGSTFPRCSSSIDRECIRLILAIAMLRNRPRRRGF